jgi:rsbT co-antagonist protein RsbR
MSNTIGSGAARTLMRDMDLDEKAIARRRRAVSLETADLDRIATIKPLVLEHLDQLVSAFFENLASVEEARGLSTSKALLDRARHMEREHLAAMVAGDFGVGYAEQRIELGTVYASAGLESRVYLGASHQLMRSIGTLIMSRLGGSPLEAFENFMALKKVAFFDIGLIVDVLVFERERTIRQQQEAIRELSTPVLQVRDRLLLLPLIGVIDTQRARLVTESLLRAIRANRAKVVVMDVTGVVTIDSKVANHIIQTVAAARLMGAQVIITGLSADVAQSLAALGIELSTLITVGDLQGGLEEAERTLGIRIAQAGGDAALLPQPGPLQ